MSVGSPHASQSASPISPQRRRWNAATSSPKYAMKPGCTLPLMAACSKLGKQVAGAPVRVDPASPPAPYPLHCDCCATSGCIDCEVGIPALSRALLPNLARVSSSSGSASAWVRAPAERTCASLWGAANRWCSSGEGRANEGNKTLKFTRQSESGIEPGETSVLPLKVSTAIGLARRVPLPGALPVRTAGSAVSAGSSPLPLALVAGSCARWTLLPAPPRSDGAARCPEFTSSPAASTRSCWLTSPLHSSPSLPGAPSPSPFLPPLARLPSPFLPVEEEPRRVVAPAGVAAPPPSAHPPRYGPRCLGRSGWLPPRGEEKKERDGLSAACRRGSRGGGRGRRRRRRRCYLRRSRPRPTPRTRAVPPRRGS
eukprot:scaffold278527_cov26-Tisochrysis_lutea.AAC.1